MSAIYGLGMQAASNIIGGGMGILFGKSQDRRQLRQQEKLQKLQIMGNKQMIDYQKMKDYEMWQKTGYGAQKEQMEEAGLNPALMYGMGGGGGQSIGGGTGGVTGGNAPVGGREIQDIMGIQMQRQMMEAQIEVMKSQANKNNVEAEKTGGVDTRLGETQIQNITQGINNLKAEEQLKKAQTRMTNLGNELAGRTIEDRIEMVNYETKRACQEAQQAVNNTNVSDATIQDKIKIIKGEAINILLRNTLTTAQTENVRKGTEKIGSDIKVNEEVIRNINNTIMQNWDKIGMQSGQNILNQSLAREGMQMAESGMVMNAIKDIINLGKKAPDTETHWEQYDEETGYGKRGSTYHKNR